MAEARKTAVFDVAIIGNGAIALSIAVWLHRLVPECRVLRIGPPRRDGCASRAAGAMLGVYGEITAGMLDTKAGRAKLEMGRRASALWPEWVELPAETCGPHYKVPLQAGTHVIAHPGDDANFDAIRKALTATDEPFEDVSPPEIPGYAPVAKDRSDRGLFLPREGAVDSCRVLAALDGYLSLAGNHDTLAEPAIGIRTDDAGRHQIECGRRTRVSARQVVIAAGAYSQGLIDTIPGLAAQLPRIHSGVGCAVELEFPVRFRSVVRTSNTTQNGSLHVVPTSETTIYLGATHHARPAPAERAAAGDLAQLMIDACETINGNFADAGMIETRMGNRPVTADGLPLIGPTQIPGIILATGTNRTGFHLAPLIGRQVACGILGRDDEPMEGLFLPERSQPVEVESRR